MTTTIISNPGGGYRMNDKSTITITMPRKGEFTIYKKDTAINSGITFVYWRDAYCGDYALTDNDWVIPVFNRYEWTDNKGVLSSVIYTPVGSFNASRRGKFIYTPNTHIVSWSFSSMEHSRLFRQDRIKMLVDLFCHLYFSKMDSREAWRRAYETAYSRKCSSRRTLSFFLTNESFRRYFMQILENTLKEVGIDQKLVLQKLKALVDDPRHKDHFNALKYVASDILAMDNKDFQPEPLFTRFLEEPNQVPSFLPESQHLLNPVRKVLEGSFEVQSDTNPEEVL